MDIANLVQATAGREQGKYFFVLETDGEYLLLDVYKRQFVLSACAPTTPTTLLALRSKA